METRDEQFNKYDKQLSALLGKVENSIRENNAKGRSHTNSELSKNFEEFHRFFRELRKWSCTLLLKNFRQSPDDSMYFRSKHEWRDISIFQYCDRADEVCSMMMFVIANEVSSEKLTIMCRKKLIELKEKLELFPADMWLKENLIRLCQLIEMSKQI